MRKYVLCAAILSLGLLSGGGLLSGCTDGGEPPYDPQSYTCTLSIQSVTTGAPDFCTAQFVSDHGTTRLTVTAPPHLAGVTIAAGEAGVTLGIPGTDAVDVLSIPLGEGAAASLRSLTDLLSTPHGEAADKRKTDAGTVLVFAEGELTLNEAGLPVFVETSEGRRAEVTCPPV